MDNTAPTKHVILVINTGSSSIKMALLKMVPNERLPLNSSTGITLAEGLLEHLGEPAAQLHWKIGDEEQSIRLHDPQACNIQYMLAWLFEHMDKSNIIAVGHRVVHGGERFIEPTYLHADVIAELEMISVLAPLHNPANIDGIRAAMQALSNIPHIAVFDTAFHHAMPKYASLYATPYQWYRDYGVRRYGFHGTSHHYVAQEAATILGRTFSDTQLLTAHLGNGCSATAVRNGIGMDTSMGFTPLEGLVMGSRSGDIDPGLHDFIAKKTGASLSEITAILNRKSGLLGISERSNDMRCLLQAAASGDSQAALAIDIFCYRLAKTLAGLCVALDRIDGIVFTGGIGEHASVIRTQTLQHLNLFGITLDEQRNANHGQHSQGFISPADATIAVLVIATEEEEMIARYVMQHAALQDTAAQRPATSDPVMSPSIMSPSITSPSIMPGSTISSPTTQTQESRS